MMEANSTNVQILIELFVNLIASYRLLIHSYHPYPILEEHLKHNIPKAHLKSNTMNENCLQKIIFSKHLNSNACSHNASQANAVTYIKQP